MAKATGKPAATGTYGEQTVARGNGGETHQTAEEGYEVLTTQQGTPVWDDQNTLRQGARGPSLIEDAHFREKIFHFDHERIPERVVHARGYGAHGYLRDAANRSPSSPGPTSSSAPASAPRCSCGSPPSRATRARSTSPATSAASR